MKEDNLLRDLSYSFALRMIKIYQYLCNEKKEFVISKQVLRSSTSIGANIREAVRGESRADFGHKLRIALKEASETEYWLELLRDSDYMEKELCESIIDDCRRIIRILTAIIKTTFSKNHES